MVTGIDIDASEVAAFASRVGNVRPMLENELEIAMIRSLAMLQNDAMEATPVATGTLRRSYKLQPAPTAWSGTLVNTATYAKVVEEGRRPGAPMPPKGALIAWMKTNGIDESLEFVIRRAIGRRGIPARNMMKNALAKNRAGIEAEFSAAIVRLAQKLRTS